LETFRPHAKSYFFYRVPRWMGETTIRKIVQYCICLYGENLMNLRAKKVTIYMKSF
jgi:hypothetical protein